MWGHRISRTTEPQNHRNKKIVNVVTCFHEITALVHAQKRESLKCFGFKTCLPKFSTLKQSFVLLYIAYTIRVVLHVQAMLFLPANEGVQKFILIKSNPSVQSGVADFNYLLLRKVNWFISEIINVLSRMMYCLILSVLHVTFKIYLKQLKDRNVT